jgi:hypothetical protein
MRGAHEVLRIVGEGGFGQLDHDLRGRQAGPVEQLAQQLVGIEVQRERAGDVAREAIAGLLADHVDRLGEPLHAQADGDDHLARRVAGGDGPLQQLQQASPVGQRGDGIVGREILQLLEVGACLLRVLGHALLELLGEANPRQVEFSGYLLRGCTLWCGPMSQARIDVHPAWRYHAHLSRREPLVAAAPGSMPDAGVTLASTHSGRASRWQTRNRVA